MAAEVRLSPVNQMQPMSGGQMVDGERVGGKYIPIQDPMKNFKPLFPGNREQHFLSLFQDAVNLYLSTREKPRDNFEDSQVDKETLVVPFPHKHTHTYKLSIQTTADAIIFQRTHITDCPTGGRLDPKQSTLTFRFDDKSVQGS